MTNIDHLMKFATENEAKADPVVGAYWTGEGWRGDVCIPHSSVRHIPTDKVLPFWYVQIAADDPELINHPACMLAVDWDAGKVIHSAIPADQIADYEVSPVFAGRDPVALLAAQ